MTKKPVWDRRFYAHTTVGRHELVAKPSDAAIEEAKASPSYQLTIAVIEERSKVIHRGPR